MALGLLVKATVRDPSGEIRWSWVRSSPPLSLANRNQSPLGERTAPFTASGKNVSCSGHPPSRGTRQSWGTPVMLVEKTICLPSGVKTPALAVRICRYCWIG
ncbi:hypothetical protein D3C86_1422590 [compost metagenome]